MSEPETTTSQTVEVQEIEPVVRPPAPKDSVAAPPEAPPTSEAVARIDAVMTKHNGNRRLAAEELRVTQMQLKNKIWYSPALYRKWKSARKPGTFPPRKSIFEKPVVVAPGTTEVEIMASSSAVTQRSNEDIVQHRLEKQDAKLRHSLKKVGLNAIEVIEAMAAQQLHANHFASTVDITTAHIAINAIKIPSILRALEKRIAKILEFPEDDLNRTRAKEVQANEADEEKQLRLVDHTKMLLNTYTDLLEEARKTGEMALHGSVIKARLNEMAKRSNVSTSTQAGRPKGSLGFNPKGKRTVVENTTQIITDNVTINNSPAQPAKAPESIPATVS